MGMLYLCKNIKNVGKIAETKKSNILQFRKKSDITAF